MLMPAVLVAEIDYNKTITDITYKGVASQVSLDAIKEIQLGSKEGRYAVSATLHRDIQQLYATGYFSEVSAESRVNTRRHSLILTLKENPIILEVNVNAIDEAIKKRVVKAFSELKNQPFNAKKLNQIRLDLETEMKEKGYDLFEILYIDFNSKTQSIDILINEGIIESVDFSGLEKIDQKIVQRELIQREGELFNSIKIQEDRTSLSRLGYFSSISSPKLENGSKENVIKIKYDLKEKKANRVEGGIERDQAQYYVYTSLINNHVLVNSDSFITRFETNFDSIQQYSIAYRQPWLFNKFNLSSTVSLFSKQFQETLNRDITYSLREGFLLSFRYPITTKLGIETRYKSEDIESAEALSNSAYIPGYKIRSLRLNLDYSSVIDRVNPTQGSYWTLSYERGGDMGFTELGGINFDSFVSSIAKFISINPKSLIALRGQYGNFTPNTESVVTYENAYFVLGGSYNLRGYNENRFPFTGVTKGLINIEYRYNLGNNFQTVLFFDYGLATSSQLDLAQFKKGYGLGFRYITPIGPIRLDLAQGEDDFFIHFGLGQIF